MGEPNSQIFNHIKEREAQKLPEMIYDKIMSIFTEFEYDIKRVEDVTRYVLDADIETALSDSVPMYCFFSYCENAMKAKEEGAEERLKKISINFNKESDAKTITERKGEAKNSEEYRKMFDLLVYYRRIRRNCESLKEAMKMRLEVARTKSANSRLPLETPWLTKQ